MGKLCLVIWLTIAIISKVTGKMSRGHRAVVNPANYGPTRGDLPNYSNGGGDIPASETRKVIDNTFNHTYPALERRKYYNNIW